MLSSEQVLSSWGCFIKITAVTSTELSLVPFNYSDYKLSWFVCVAPTPMMCYRFSCSFLYAQVPRTWLADNGFEKLSK